LIRSLTPQPLAHRAYAPEGKLQGMRSLLRFKGVKVLGQGFDKKLVNDEMLEQFF